MPILPSFTACFSLTPENERQTRRHLLWWILVRVILISLLVSLSSFFRAKGLPVIAPPGEITLFFVLGIYLFSLGSAVALQKNVWAPQRFGVIQLLFDMVFIALVVYATGCSQSFFTPLFLLPVITAGLIHFRMGGLILAAATTLTCGGIILIEALGLTPDYFALTSYKKTLNLFAITNHFAIYGLMYFLAALISGQLAKKLHLTEEELSKRSLEFDRLAILYKQIFDDISTGIITTDSTNTITSCNQAAERITGYARMLMHGQPFASRFPSISLQQNKQGRNVCDFVKRDGNVIRLGYSLSNLNMPVEEGRDDQQAKWKVITLQDISQIERMELQIRETEKLAAIGQMSASVAHGFRNPLAAISGSAQILHLEQDNLATIDPATFKTLMGIILRESARMAKTITDFLQFSRPAAIQAEWFDLNRLVDEVIAKLLRGPYAAAAAGITKSITHHLGCWGDRQQIQTVLTQLLENACAAMESRPDAVSITGVECKNGDNSALLIEIQDQGPGIAPELRTKVFEPFFSNRPDGTGLGLAIVRQIVENHRGEITIDENTPCGTIFRLSLPLPQTGAIL